MCGIAGLFDPDSRPEELAQQVRSMTDLLLHRGPDDEGFVVRGPAALGMRRLSIIDIAGGHQPIGNEDGALQVVQNGEIYNYLELQELLRARGHRLATSGDTEVLVHLYEEFGADFPGRLNGMFAFAIWDGRRREVLLGRDRFGKKPLYLASHGGRHAWASEIKPLLSLPWVSRRMRPEALNLLLRHNYVPGPTTLFDGITELPSGTTLTISTEKTTARVYWSLSTAVARVPEAADFDGLVDRAADLFDDAVRLRMRSDVPVALFLSGGVDSSLIADRMVAHLPGGRVRSIAMAFDECGFDESVVAAEVAAIVGTDHCTVRGALSGNLDFWKDVIWHAEEPHGDASFMPTLLLAQAAARTHKVVMTGDGGDEIFGGYTKYQTAWSRAAETSPAAAWAESIRAQQVVVDDLRAALLTPDWHLEVAPAVEAPPLRLQDPGDVVRNLMWRDCAGLLTDNNVIKPDRMGMAASLEARCPFLDYRLGELALAVPGGMHVDGDATKRILRTLMRRRFPPAITDRSKQQFTVPVGEWMRADVDGSYQAALKRLLTRGIFEPAPVWSLWESHRVDGRQTRVLRVLVAFELWCELYVDADPLTFRPGTPVGASIA